MYGHTHKNDIRKIHNTLVINPGEGGGWLYGDKTLAILDLEKMKAEIIRID
ncbi:MAG: metallophosphoesterase family protein [Methanosarcinales archaeon]